MPPGGRQLDLSVDPEAAGMKLCAPPPPSLDHQCLSPVPTGFLIGDARHKLGGPKVFPMAVMVRPGRNRARSVRYQTVVGTAFDRNVASRAFNNVSQSRGAQEVTHVIRNQKNSRRPGALEQG